MSQEKVNRYKVEKANRKQTIKKEKRNRMISRTVGTIIGLALVAWIGFSIYDSVDEKLASAQTEVDLSAIDDYLTELNATETATK